MKIISKIAQDEIRISTLAVSECEEALRILIKEGFFKGKPKNLLLSKANATITKYVKQIDIPRLQSAAYRSLTAFAVKQYAELRRTLGLDFLFLAAVLFLSQGNQEKRVVQKVEWQAGDLPVKTYTNITQSQAESVIKRKILSQTGIIPVNGQAMAMYSRDYMKKKVVPILKQLSNENALDPDDISGRNSLRNRAEMEARYDGHLQQIADLKKQTNLVICSTHTDCSRRCMPWQGKVYSLDGTSGTTDDGRKFIPLETATDIYYTTKAGITYKNGLLGFNCRHYLVAYENGLQFISPPKEQVKKEYSITKTQRAMERQVRLWRAKSLEFKGIDKAEYENAKRKAERSFAIYKNFSYKNHRAYYESRVEL